MRNPSSNGHARQVWTIAAVFAALILVLPIGFTTAYLTDTKTAADTSGGTGRWCSVPTPEKQPNVYRLKDFPTHQWSGSGTSSMIIVPVVRNGEFGPGGGDGRLGVRAWACQSSSLTTSSSIKITSWRNASSNQGTMNWLNRVGGDGFASHRLSLTSDFGAQLAKLHREGSTNLLGAGLTFNDRQRYTWLMSSGRDRSSTSASPTCLTNLCTLDIDPYPTFSAGFQADTAGTREAKNSVEYLASSYWKDAGTWTGGVVTRPTEQPVNLTAYSGSPKPPFANGTGPASTDGRQVEWVVMEWWGSTAPTDDMVLEVFVR